MRAFSGAQPATEADASKTSDLWTGRVGGPTLGNILSLPLWHKALINITCSAFDSMNVRLKFLVNVVLRTNLPMGPNTARRPKCNFGLHCAYPATETPPPPQARMMVEMRSCLEWVRGQMDRMIQTAWVVLADGVVWSDCQGGSSIPRSPHRQGAGIPLHQTHIELCLS